MNFILLVPLPSRLASISSTSKGEWKDTKLPKYRLHGNAYLSMPGGSGQTRSVRGIEGLKGPNLKKELVAEEMTPLQMSLGESLSSIMFMFYLVNEH